MLAHTDGNTGVHRANPERIAVILVMLIATVHVSPLVFEHVDASSTNDDWTQIFAFQAFLTDQVVTTGTLPERSHILGGGFPIVGHPEYPILSPVALPVLALGPVLGVRFAAAAYFLLGVFGMWAWLRKTGFGPPVAAYGSLVYATSGWFVAIMASGNFPQIYYLWLPLWLWLVIPESDTAPRLDGRLAAAAVLGAIALTDGHLNTVCTLLVVGFFGLTSGRRALERTTIFGVLVVALGAFKLVPTLALLAIEDRSIDTYSAEFIETATLSSDLFVSFIGRPDGFPLGWLPWAISLLALRHIQKPDVIRLFAVFILASLFWLGPQAPIDLFWLLTRLPVLGSIDAPSKYFVFFIGFAAIALGCYGLQVIPKTARTPAAVVASIISAGLLMWHGSPELTRPFDRLDEPGAPPIFVPYKPLDTDYFVASDWSGTLDQRPDLYFMYRRGTPLVRWEDNFQLASTVVPASTLALDGTVKPNPDTQPLVSLNGEQLPVKHFSANRISFQIPQLGVPQEVVINQNGDSGWFCDGAEIKPNTSRLTLNTMVNATQITCTYRSRPLRIGVGISTATLMLLLGYFGLRRRRRHHA